MAGVLGECGRLGSPRVGLELFVHTEEGMEGAKVFAEKRTPDFSPYR